MRCKATSASVLRIKVSPIQVQELGKAVRGRDLEAGGMILDMSWLQTTHRPPLSRARSRAGGTPHGVLKSHLP